MSEVTRLSGAGERYGATVPDTLDLAHRAALALNGLGGTTDPDMGYLHYFTAGFACRPPYLSHHGADTTCTPKYAESFPMMRLMCGSDLYEELQERQLAALVKNIEDGLYWNRYDPARPWATSYNPAFDGERKAEDLTNVGGNGRMLRALVTVFELDPRPGMEERIREMVGGLRRIAVDRGEYSFYPDGGFGEPFNYPRSGWIRTDEPKSETEGGEGAVTAYQAHQIQALARWFALSGDKKALDLAGRLTRFCMLPKFWGGLPDPGGKRDGLVGHVAPALPDPACVSGEEQGHWFSHFHARAIALRGILEYGMAAGDLRVLEFVQRAYEYTWTFGIPRMGWVNTYPCALNRCEGCALGDLVALGIRLTDAGLGDWWDAVDAVVRNQLVEQQYVRADLLERVSAAGAERGPDQQSKHPRQELREGVIERSVGIFGGTATPTSVPQASSMTCCTGNGTQGLYYAWEGALRESGESAQVNLLLNRAARLVDVDSYLPYKGKVVIRSKGARRVCVRIPSWVNRRELRASVRGQPRMFQVGNYVVFDGLYAGDVLTLMFPVAETTDRYTVNARTPAEQAYTCTFRGGTLVDISPRDEAPTSYPLYLRSHMRADKAPMKQVERFVPRKLISRW